MAGLGSSGSSREDERSDSSESLRHHHLTFERNSSERLPEQGSVVATGLDGGGDSQSTFEYSQPLLDTTNMLKVVINNEVQDLEGASNSLEESNQILRKLVHALLEHIEALVSCLDEVRREAENRTAQMQRRLRSSADITRATVVSLCDWGEEFQNLISRKCHAEEAAHDLRHMVDVLQKENSQLRQHSANLYHDIHSLLTIINEARATGNWVMDCVTFCEISPEEVYGPVCNISAQQTDMVIPDSAIDENPDVQAAENSDLQVMETGITEVCSESDVLSKRPVNTYEEMSLGHCSNSLDSPPCSSTPFSYRNRQQVMHELNDLPLVGGAENGGYVKQLRANTPWMCTETKSSKRSASLPMLPLAAQGCPELYSEDGFEQKGRSLESVHLSWKRRANKVRRCLIFNLPRGEPAVPQHEAIKPENVGLTRTVNTLVTPDKENWTHVTVGIQTGASVTASCAEMYHGPLQFQDDVTRIEAAGKTFQVMGTQTDAEYEDQDDPSASFPTPFSEPEIEDISELSSGIAFLSRSASEESSGLFSAWRKRERDAQKRRLLFNSSKRELGAPDHCRNAQLVDSAVNTEHILVGLDVERSTLVSVSAQTDATVVTCCESTHCRPPELKDVVIQTEASTSDKTFGVTGTQTDVDWENFPLTGQQERDRELRSLKERLNLAAEEVQSKNMLATQLQTHLDSSLKQVEISVQALQNVEKKLQMSREECENLKKQLVSTQGKLESTEKALEMERMANTQSMAEIQNLALTVQHLQATLVNLKKNGGSSPKESSSGTMPKVHDV